jgi:hypothetical protein
VDEEAQTQVGGGYPRLEANAEETAAYLQARQQIGQ